MKRLSLRHPLLLAAFTGIVFIISCNKFKNTPISSAEVDTNIPQYFVGADETFNAQIHLGRVLFYDKNLSVNNFISCASCHKQALAFADNTAFSTGFENRLTKRNSMAIQNITSPMISIEGSPLFWDGREPDLNSLIAKPIANHIEMGITDFDQLLKKLNSLSYYRPILDKAYGTGSTLSLEGMSAAMTQFILQFQTMHSRFDEAQMGSGSLNALEVRGRLLFNTTYNCVSCHNPMPGMYQSSGFHNIGLESSIQDKGRMDVTGNSSDEGLFRAPDLHNVALTAPYMHDGRFNTLDEVLNHYSHGIQENKNLSEVLRNDDGSALKMNITAEDRKALIAFLNSMTDYQMVSNPLLSNPFK
jgi:cytochrome c peroxidase